MFDGIVPPRPGRPSLLAALAAAVRQLPSPRRLLELGPHDGAHRVALRAGVAVGLPLLALWAVGRMDLALFTTFGAFTSLYGRSHAHVTRAKLQSTVAAALVTGVAIGGLVALSPQRLWLVVPIGAVFAGAVTLLANAYGWRPAGSLFPVFALTATASIPTDLPGALLSTGLAAGAAALALVIGVSGLVRSSARQLPRGRWDVDPVRAARQRGTGQDVGRTVVAVLVAGAVPTALGLDYPYWSMIAAAASISGADVAARFVRAGHRLVGTLLGVGIAAVILALHPPLLLTVAIVAALQVGAELFVVRNYGLALVFVTPLALVMIALAHPQDVGGLLWHRLLETVIGVLVVIAITLVEHVAVALRRSV